MKPFYSDDTRGEKVNTKQLISNLLYEISHYACAESIRNTADAVQDVLDAGAFDYLVEYAGNEPPDNRRNVQVICSKYSGWITAYFENKWGWRTIPGLYSPGDVLAWRELPPIPEVTK